MHDAHTHHHGDRAHTGLAPREAIRAAGQRRLTFVLAITAAFMVVELVGGWIANSLALIADAGHMLSDVAALALSAFALHAARRPATPDKSFGFHRIEILAALGNATMLIVISLAIFWQAWARLRTPEPVEATLMLAVAAAGLAVNIAAAWLLHSHSGHNLNLRGAYLHVLGDLLGSLGAILAAVTILTTGWSSADPIISCFVATLILFGAWRLLRESVDVLLEATPSHIDLDAVRHAIAAIPGVEAVEDLHVWTLTSGFIAMSGHAIASDASQHRRILDDIHRAMHSRFGIGHVTVQLDHRAIYRIGKP
ncbi:MAG: cation diffusion facilitator family transporter [Longimicrobiales bacterium]